jgi:Ala-tRNA(Pro) deacylase
MINVSDITTSAPAVFKSGLQEKVYERFNELGISFERVDTDEVITMEDCAAINSKMNMDMVKTLFLCNRQQTEFYMFVTRGGKPFSSKDFSRALGVSRASFAPKELLLTMLGTHIGAATVLSMLNDPEGKVEVVMDEEVADTDSYGCSDGTTTSYLKLKTSDVIGKFLPSTGHRPMIIKV